jgi:hypothetical protein
MMIICLIWAFYGIAAPHDLLLYSTDNITHAQSVTDPQNMRTIWSVIWSCLTIIFACTRTAIHPNISNPKDAKWTIQIRKIKMCLMAIVAPECMVLMALRQLPHAKKT